MFRLRIWHNPISPTLLLLLLLLPGVTAWAATGRTRTTALQELADSVIQQVAELLQAETQPPRVGLLVVPGESLQGKGERIAQELEKLVLHGLERGTATETGVLVRSFDPRELRILRGRGVSLLLRCVVGIDGNKLHATVDLVSLQAQFWARLAGEVPRSSAHHFFASNRIDKEIHLLMGKSRAAVSMGEFHLQELLVHPAPIVDIGFGDLDGDGEPELLILDADGIDVHRLQGNRAERLYRHSLTDQPAAEVLSRDASGQAWIGDFNQDGRAEVFYKLFNQRRGAILVGDTSRLQSLREFPDVPLCVIQQGRRPRVIWGTPVIGTNVYQSTLQVADVNGSDRQSWTLPTGFNAFRCWQDAPDTEPVMGFVDGRGSLYALSAQVEVRPVAGPVGDAFVVADLDGDSAGEWVLSERNWANQTDRVRILDGQEPIWQSGDLVGGVVAMAAGGDVGDGSQYVLVAVVDPGGARSRVLLLGR